MNWKEIIEHIRRFLVADVYDDLYDVMNERNRCYNDLSETAKNMKLIDKQYEELQQKYLKATEKKSTYLEKFCSLKYGEIPNKAYKGKRKWQTNPISTYINQFITPNHFEVMKLRKYITRGDNITLDARNIGNKISRDFVWTSDRNLDTSGDYYLYPEEIIVDKKGDCEDHAFTVASLNPEIGIAYGFLNKSTGRIGHAFNVFVEKGKLYILETTGSSGVIREYENQQKYEIYFIVTQNKTYRVKSGVEFGRIAGW